MEKIFENSTTTIYLTEDKIQICHKKEGKEIILRYEIYRLLQKLSELLNNDIKPYEPTGHKHGDNGVMVKCDHEFISVPRNRYSNESVAQCRKCEYRP